MYNQPVEEMKPWQKGFDIQQIKEYRAIFDRGYNVYSRSPFSQWNNPKIADSLSRSRLQKVWSDCNLAGYIDSHVVKTGTNVKMHSDVILGRKEKGDRVVSALGYAFLGAVDCFVDALNKFTEPTWAFIWEEDPVQREIVALANFKKIGVKVTSFAEIYGVYFRDAAGENRKHPEVSPAEFAAMLHLSFPNFGNLAEAMGERLEQIDSNFANHYSKYNKAKAWSAVSLRGFSSDITMIEKPNSMNAAWHKEHEGENFDIQDTEMMALFPEVQQILRCFPTRHFERIRFMKLAPGGGELSRHVDAGESGMADGLVMRFHIPIITNPGVIFTMWDTNGEKKEQNMKVGETWLFDFRKPHMAINNGDKQRIHLVIDVYMDQAMRNFIAAHL